MKRFERIILNQLMKSTKPHLDPYQFAYKHNRSTEDATLTLSHNASLCNGNLEKPGSFVRILFIDFSSALQPQFMASKLLKLNVNPRLIFWIVDFLVNRSQTVLHQTVPSSSCPISTGTPQGTVLSLILFTLYTNDYIGTAMENLSDSDSVYFTEVERLKLVQG